MSSLLRRIPPRTLVFGLYIVLVAFAFFAWKN